MKAQIILWLATTSFAVILTLDPAKALSLSFSDKYWSNKPNGPDIITPGKAFIIKMGNFDLLLKIYERKADDYHEKTFENFK